MEKLRTPVVVNDMLFSTLLNYLPLGLNSTCWFSLYISARFEPIALFIFTTMKSILVLPCEIVRKKHFKFIKGCLL